MRRRKAKFTWFPCLGSTITGDAGTVGVSYTELLLSVQNDSSAAPVFGTDLVVAPLVADYTLLQGQLAGLETSLRDQVEGQDWILKRIVGNINVGVSNNNADGEGTFTQWPNVLVAAGFFVARANDANQNVPDTFGVEQLDPLGVDNVANPWIWRRSWILSSLRAVGGNLPFGELWAPSNIYYGDIRTGPHIDSKVSRRVIKEHRLWLAVRALGYFPGAATFPGPTQPQVSVNADLRFLGAMRRGRNRSSF